MFRISFNITKTSTSTTLVHVPYLVVRRLHTVRSESDLTASRLENEKPSNLTPTVQYEAFGLQIWLPYTVYNPKLKTIHPQIR